MVWLNPCTKLVDIPGEMQNQVQSPWAVLKEFSSSINTIISSILSQYPAWSHREQSADQMAMSSTVRSSRACSSKGLPETSWLATGCVDDPAIESTGVMLRGSSVSKPSSHMGWLSTFRLARCLRNAGVSVITLFIRCLVGFLPGFLLNCGTRHHFVGERHGCMGTIGLGRPHAGRELGTAKSNQG